MGITLLLNTESEYDCTEEINEDNVVKRVIAPTESETQVEPDDTIVAFASLDKKLGVLELVKQMCDLFCM